MLRVSAISCRPELRRRQLKRILVHRLLPLVPTAVASCACNSAIILHVARAGGDVLHANRQQSVYTCVYIHTSINVKKIVPQLLSSLTRVRTSTLQTCLTSQGGELQYKTKN